MSLKRIRLERVESRTAPISDRRHYYVFQASLSDDGQLEKRGYSAVCHMCKVNKFERGSGHMEGRLILSGDGWAFACTCRDQQHPIDVEKLDSDIFVPGRFISIMSRDGNTHLFRVVSVDPVHFEILH